MTYNSTIQEDHNFPLTYSFGSLSSGSFSWGFWQHSWRSRSLVRFFGGDVEMQCYSHQSKKHGKFDMPTNGNQSKKHVKYRNLLTKPSPWQNRCNPSFFTCIWALVNLTHLWLQDHHDIIYAHELYIQTFQTH